MSELLPYITWDSGDAPDFSILWLHGLGASGDDFVPVAQELRLPQAVRHLFPQAPQRPVTLNGGYVMPAWYDISSSKIDDAQDAEGIAASALAVEALIAHEVARGIAPDHIFVAGFSQGGAIALQVGLRAKQKLGGVLALSTYLALADTAEHAACQDTPVFMAHGLQDPVVPCALGRQSAAILEQLGCRVNWREYAMPHSVCMEEIRDIGNWLTQQMEIVENMEKSSG